MSCFDQQTVPVISTLATEFALFDAWHASVPGPTMPNRAYAGSATSRGAGSNNAIDIALGYEQKSLFQSLNESGRSWGIYFEEIPTMLQLRDVRITSNTTSTESPISKVCILIAPRLSFDDCELISIFLVVLLRASTDTDRAL